ncbi:MAG: hypothetical protein NC078_01895 [Ruminococcus sp.]|nr:hypothetical protein [Ruminococcus sp.]
MLWFIGGYHGSALPRLKCALTGGGILHTAYAVCDYAAPPPDRDLLGNS